MSNVPAVQQIRGGLVKMKDQIEAGLPKHMDADRFIRVAMTAIQQNPALTGADRHSLYGACMKCASDGLLPDGSEAALVTFGKTVQYMPMVSGILKKVRNSGELKTITSQVVYENDQFDFYVDERGEHLTHHPRMFGDRGKIQGVYAVATTKDNAVYTEVLSMTDINAIKGVSRGKNGPWSGPFATEMMRKSAIRRLAKRLPMSTDLETVIKRDDELYDFNKPQAEAATTPGDRLEGAMGISSQPDEVQEVELAPADAL